MSLSIFVRVRYAPLKTDAQTDKGREGDATTRCKGSFAREGGFSVFVLAYGGSFLGNFAGFRGWVLFFLGISFSGKRMRKRGRKGSWVGSIGSKWKGAGLNVKWNWVGY